MHAMQLISKVERPEVMYITMKQFTQYNTSFIIIVGSTLIVDLAYNCMALMSH